MFFFKILLKIGIFSQSAHGDILQFNGIATVFFFLTKNDIIVRRV